MLRDCANDWPGGRGRANNGHDMLEMTLHETTIDDLPHLIVGLHFREGFVEGNLKAPELRQVITMKGPEGTKMSTITTKDDVNFDTDPSGGIEAVAIHGPTKTGDVPRNITISAVYKARDWGVYQGENLTATSVVSWNAHSSRADRLAGGYWVPVTGPYQADCSDNTTAAPSYFDRGRYTMQLGKERPILPNQAPVADFFFTPSQPKPNQSIAFTDLSTDDGGIIGWNWDLGDGNTSTLRDIDHIYGAVGNYSVTLAVTDDEGESSQVTKVVKVTQEGGTTNETGGNNTGGGGNNTGGDGGNQSDPGPDAPTNQPPEASFEFTPRAPAAGQDMTLRDTSFDPDGSVVAWDWILGDGSTSRNKDVTHRYNAAGTYEVRLRVTDDDGATDSQTVQFVVSGGDGPVNQAPVSVFDYEPTAPTTKDVIRFRDLSVDPDGQVTTYSWDLGGLATATSRDPTFRFRHAGIYTVSLTVTDDRGASHVSTTDIEVTAATERAQNTPPLADFSWSPRSPTTSDRIQFQDASQDDHGIVAWFWDFGDGSQSSSPSPVHRYIQPGSYTVHMTVDDAEGLSDVMEQTLIVESPRTGVQQEQLDNGRPQIVIPGPGVAILGLGAAGAALMARRHGY